MLVKKKIIGLITFSMGVGMLLAILVPTWVLAITIILLAFGVWNLFYC